MRLLDELFQEALETSGESLELRLEFGEAGSEVELYPELFPELEFRGIRRPARFVRRIPFLRRRAGSPQVLSPGANVCLLRRDSEILDFFKFNSAALRPFHIREIREIAERIKNSFSGSNPLTGVTIIGHTDERGSDDFNKKLGKQRAESAAARLKIELGPSAPKVTIVTDSNGESSPISLNSIDRGRACNRRIQFFFNISPSLCSGRSVRNFFTEYDLRTFPAPPSKPFGIDMNPALSQPEKDQRREDVLAVAAILRTRQRINAGVALRKRQPILVPVPPAIKQAAVRLSKVQFDLFRESFPSASAPMDLLAIRKAFLDFANGDLRTPDVGPNMGINEPDSSAYFLFAEFAFLCVEEGIDAQEWTKILPWFVASQEIFIFNYRKRPHSAPPKINSPLPPVCDPVRHPLKEYEFKNFDGFGKSDERRKADLIGKYGSLNLAQLRVAHLENHLRAQCAP